MKQYQLVFGVPLDFKILFEGTLEDCFENRKQSGDLVIYAGTTEVVESANWLWEWEKQDPYCYARKAQKNGWTF